MEVFALQEAESNRHCRRLQLKDIIPVETQRLTKYPLLLENIAKYTGTAVSLLFSAHLSQLITKIMLGLLFGITLIHINMGGGVNSPT